MEALERVTLCPFSSVTSIPIACFHKVACLEELSIIE